jgi:acyl dehydratase
MQLSDLTPGRVIVVGGRKVTELEIVEFESRFLGTSADTVGDVAKGKRKSAEITASGWMMCAIAQELASRTVLGELWRAGPPSIERVIWWDSVRPGDEVRLQIEILERRLSGAGTAGWVRWHWTLATQLGSKVLDLIAGSLIEDRPPPQKGPMDSSPNRMAYKVSEAARLVGISRYVLYEAIRNQELRAYSYSPRGDLRLLPGDLYAWVTRFGPRPESSQGSRRDEAKADSEEANAV